MENKTTDTKKYKINFKFYLLIIMVAIIFSFSKVAIKNLRGEYNFFKSGYFNYLLSDYKNALSIALFQDEDLKEPTLDTLTSSDIEDMKNQYIAELSQKYAEKKNQSYVEMYNDSEMDTGDEFVYDEDLDNVLEAKKQKDLENISEEINKTINNENSDEIKEKALKQKLEQYKTNAKEKIRAQKILDDITYFKYYYVKDGVKTNVDLKNGAIDEQKKEALNVESISISDITENITFDGTKVYIITPSYGIDGTGKFKVNFDEFNKIKNVYINFVTTFTIVSIAGVIFIIAKEKNSDNKIIDSKEIKFLAYKIPTDVIFGAFVLVVFNFIITYVDIGYGLHGFANNSLEISENISIFYKDMVRLFIAWVLMVGIIITIIKIIWDYKKDKKCISKLLDSSIVLKAIKNVNESINKKSYKKSILLKFLILVSIMMTTVFLCAMDSIEAAIMMLVIWVFILFLMVLTWILSLEKIVNGVRAIAKGESSKPIVVKHNRVLKELASDISNIGQGIKNAVEKETKSERLRTELITNVSHDLKTPLTSIISYIDILKGEDISDDQRKSYTDIIDRKAQSLKMLIEDLFDMTKMTSGNVELALAKSDIIMLLNQTIGEFNDKIETSGLDFKFDIPDKAVYLDIDGKKIWRVFQNLIVNVLKYSQSGTRVYVVLKEFEDSIEFEVKNISAYEMNFNADELFERFKRGDESRNTEGTGLGLAIAQSIVKLHKGNLEIKIDGDLFKVIMTLYK